MNQATRWAAGALCLALAACATSPCAKADNSAQPPDHAGLVPGTTLQSEVRQRLGPGKELRFASGWSTWLYVERDGLPRFLDFVPLVGEVTSRVEATESELVLLFNPRACCKGSGAARQHRARAAQAALTHAVRAGHQDAGALKAWPTDAGERSPPSARATARSSPGGHTRWVTEHLAFKPPQLGRCRRWRQQRPWPPVGKSASSSHPRKRRARRRCGSGAAASGRAGR